MESFTIRAREFRLQKCLLGWLVAGDSACQRLKPQHLHHQPATSATLVALVLGMPKVGCTTSSFLLRKYLTISTICPAADVAGVRQGVISSRRDKISTDQTNLIKQTTLSKKVYTFDATPTPHPVGRPVAPLLLLVAT